VNSSGALVDEILGHDSVWFIEGQTVFIRMVRKPQPSLREMISGDLFAWNRIPISSLSEEILVVGDASWGHRYVMKRAAENRSRSQTKTE
jgi:hypothetical protein